MSTIPVSNPDIPFVGLIPGSAKLGQIFKISGHTDQTGEHCDINLQNIPSGNSNKILHISIRPREQEIVRNHFENGWGPEERDGKCPIGINEPFNIVILIRENHFKIAVNGRHFCAFKHRLSLDDGKYIQVGGACTVRSIRELENNTVVDAIARNESKIQELSEKLNKMAELVQTHQTILNSQPPN